MKKYLLFASVALLSVTACKKNSSNNTVTPATTTGSIQFVNNSSNPYKVYIDGGSMGTLSGKKSSTYTVTYGSHACQVIQISGYALYPTNESFNVVVSSTSNGIVSFP